MTDLVLAGFGPGLTWIAVQECASLRILPSLQIAFRGCGGLRRETKPHYGREVGWGSRDVREAWTLCSRCSRSSQSRNR